MELLVEEGMMTKNKITTIYIVRHGESEYNALTNENLYIPGQWGVKGAPLTNEGKKQARKRAEDLKHVKFDAIFSADVARAMQTAEIIKLERKLAIQTTNIIHERLSYMLLGKTFTETEKEIRKTLEELDEKAKMAYKPEGQDEMRNESINENATRMLTFLREIAVTYEGKTVLVVNHANNMKAILLHLGFATFDEISPKGTIENIAYIVLESDGVDFFVKETKGIHKYGK